MAWNLQKKLHFWLAMALSVHAASNKYSVHRVEKEVGRTT